MKLLSVKFGVILLIIGLAIYSYAEVWGADWEYQEFNRRGILFQYPKSFNQLPQEDLLKMKRELSETLDFAIKNGLALCGERFIEDLTVLTPNDKFEVSLSVMIFQFKKAPTVDCFLRERKLSLSDVPPVGYEIKPGKNVKVLSLDKTKLSRYDAIIEDIEITDRGNRIVGLHILVGKTVYEVSWFVHNKSKFKDWEKPFIQIIDTIKIEKR